MTTRERFPCEFYIDESGNPYLTPKSIAEHRYLAILAAVLAPQTAHEMEGAVEEAVRRFFPHLPPSEVYIKSTRIRLRKHPFNLLSDQQLKMFTDALYSILLDAGQAIRLFGFVIDKQAHVEQYAYPHDPYELGFKFLLERFAIFMGRREFLEQARIIFDSRGKKGRRSPDKRLRVFHEKIATTGTEHFLPSDFARIRFPAEFVDSRASRMIQLVDLCAYNLYAPFAHDKPNYPYLELILPLFDRNPNKPRQILGAGIKLFPKAFEQRAGHYIEGKK